jgi:putative two-component system response regulator
MQYNIKIRGKEVDCVESLFDTEINNDGAQDAGRYKILCVDDTPFMLRTISSILKDEYEMFSLTKGAMVTKFLQHTKPDLFLLDYNMPGINGFELVPVIRSFEEHKETPIIFITAMGTSAHVKNAVSLGACDYIVKPVVPGLLREKVRKHLGIANPW